MWKQTLLGVAVSVAAVYLFLKAAPPAQMVSAFGQMHLIYLLPCAAAYLLTFVFRALRWHYLMRPLARVPFRPLYATLMVGFLGNNLLPAHLGEVVRAIVLGRLTKVPKSAVFATVVLERVYDGLTVLLMLLVVLTFMDLPLEGGMLNAHTLREAGWWGLALFGGLMMVLQFFRWKREASLKVCAWCLRPLPTTLGDKILSAVDTFADGLAMSRARDIVWVAVYSLLVWGGLALWAWSLFPAFGLHLPLLAGVLLEVVVSLALLIPSAPAFVGTFHLAAAATLSFMGANGGVAGSYAMALWMVHFVISTLVGLYYLWKLDLGWKAFSWREPAVAAEVVAPEQDS
ncbi:MAG: flippase-like domain-containing protein [Deltaproteobacteria bacterium]|nr:flippase-like domain-containing protein [Deltaproteobacteria bacterium]